MDMPGNEKESENPMNYDTSPGMTSQWQQLRESNLINTSIGMIQMPNSMVESFSCSAPLVFDHSISAQNPSYCDVNITNDASASTSHGLMKPDMIWAQQNAIFRGSNVLLPTVPRMIPPSLPHFPADLGFIERAARFSCFSGGNFGDVSLKTFNGSSNIPYSQGLGMMQRPCEVVGVNGLKPLSANQSQRRETIRTEAMLSPLNDEKKTEARDVIDDFVGNTMSDEAEISGRRGQEESNVEFSGKGSGCKKRKRPGQDMEHKERNELTGNAAPGPSTETANNNTKGSKHGGKNIKEGSQGSDQQPEPKEGYIHVRARRGQATNSHSLAERVRREKISERMKFLQDLVPGCSKVTGKAVMLDEIINYVQSLQRQVEFLSMKLATVNPRLDFNIEGLLAKDILQPRGGGLSSSPSLPFPMNRPLTFPPFHHSLPGQVQAGLTSLCNNTSPGSNVHQLTQSCGGFKEPTSSSQANLHIPNMWDDELHNVVEMGFDSTADPLNSQGLNGSVPEGQMKTEP